MFSQNLKICDQPLETQPKSAIEIQLRECREELREATIERAIREAEWPELYRNPDPRHLEMGWKITQLRAQLHRLEHLCMQERAGANVTEGNFSNNQESRRES